MLHFWETMVRPSLDALEPRAIVEIGSDRGDNTRHLLEFCRESGATLHVIDPVPKYEVSEWQEEYGETFVPHLALSLEVLPELDTMDVVLVDGDHNWYTVFNELKTIQERCAGLSRPFPLVLLHDVGWPYGRRDLYYDPENIPEEHRRPHAQKGLLRDTGEAVEDGGLNPHLHNALQENEPRSGVLTAVEDFLEQTEERLDLVRVPGLYGLAVLVRLDLLEQNERLAALLEDLRMTPTVHRHVETLEEVRVDAMIQAGQSDTHAREEGRRAARLEKNLEQQAEKTESARRELAEEREQRERTQRQLAERDRELQELRRSLSHHERRLAERDEALRLKTREAERLASWLERAEKAYSALLASRQWKAGHALGELQRKALRRPRVTSASDSLGSIFEQFRDWRDADR